MSVRWGKYYGDSDYSVFFFNDTATTEIYTLSLHDALPIFPGGVGEHRLRDQGDDDNFGMDFSGVAGGAAVCCVSGCGGVGYTAVIHSRLLFGCLCLVVHQRNAVGGEIADTASSAGDWATAE